MMVERLFAFYPAPSVKGNFQIRKENRWQKHRKYLRVSRRFTSNIHRLSYNPIHTMFWNRFC